MTIALAISQLVTQTPYLPHVSFEQHFPSGTVTTGVSPIEQVLCMSRQLLGLHSVKMIKQLLKATFKN